MITKTHLLIAAGLFLTFILFSAQPVDAFIWNRPTTTTGILNKSEIWITDVAELDTINASQFSGPGGVLNIALAWLQSMINVQSSNLFVEKSGDVMGGDLLINNNSNIVLTNGSNISGESSTHFQFVKGGGARVWL